MPLEAFQRLSLPFSPSLSIKMSTPGSDEAFRQASLCFPTFPASTGTLWKQPPRLLPHQKPFQPFFKPPSAPEQVSNCHHCLLHSTAPPRSFICIHPSSFLGGPLLQEPHHCPMFMQRAMSSAQVLHQYKEMLKLIRVDREPSLATFGGRSQTLV